MRVIAGIARSLPLKAPEGLSTRPTTDRIKETLFNILQNQISGCVFVDLFSGSGGIGIEAISRGASHCYFVENGKQALSCIQDNLKFTKFEDKATVLKQDVLSSLQMIHEKEVDIIFMDPPYEDGYEETVLQSLIQMPYVTDNTSIIVEALMETDFSFAEALGYDILREKCYKTNKHVFLARRVEKK